VGKRGIEGVGRLLGHVGGDMAVDARGESNPRAAKLVRHHLQGDTGLEQPGGVGVAGIM
jgi:hypothetical protein